MLLAGQNGSAPIIAPNSVTIMPVAVTFLQASLLLLWSSVLGVGSAVPWRRADSCSGYKASNVVRGESSLIADLTLVGEGCGVYGRDLVDLKFLAEWQTGM